MGWRQQQQHYDNDNDNEEVEHDEEALSKRFLARSIAIEIDAV